MRIEHKIQTPSERVPFYEYQLFIKDFNDYIEVQNEKALKEEGKETILSLKKEDYGI